MIIMCGSCRSQTIPAKVGIHPCSNCGKAHEIEKKDEYYIVYPYPRPDSYEEGRV